MKSTNPNTRKWGDGILRTAGALADDLHWDAIMAEVHRSRRLARRPQLGKIDPSAGHEHLCPHATPGLAVIGSFSTPADRRI